MSIEIYLTKGDNSLFLGRPIDFTGLSEYTKESIAIEIDEMELEIKEHENILLCDIIATMSKKELDFQDRFEYFTELYRQKIEWVKNLRIISMALEDGWKVEVSQ
jgi:hypothetical protein